MKFLTIFIGILCAQLMGGAPALALEPLDLSTHTTGPVGAHVLSFQEESGPLDLQEALHAYEAGRFEPVGRATMSFGIAPDPVWLALGVENPYAQALERHILIEVAWIDQIDLYVLHAGEVVERIHTGDTLPFAARPVASRYFDVPHAFKPGATQVLMRVQSADPMDLPIHLATAEKAKNRSVLEAYSYGLLYGGILALLAYNFLLFFGLKRARYAYYTLYLACFLAMNFAYTGHGYQWLWPDSPLWQQWGILIFMLAYGLSGLLFAVHFLETKRYAPKLNRLAGVSAVIFVALMAASIFAFSHESGVYVAFVFALYFSLLMVVLGIAAVMHSVTSAKYFLFAMLAGAGGAATTAVSVWGIVPYSVWGYRAVEIGVMIEAVLLALALADWFRVNQEQKTLAEKLARIDPLTGLNNRRGFHEMVAPVWSTGLRHNRAMSVVILDLDHFKAFNDTYGHAMGDKLLAAVAGELRRIGREGDIAARWGGEEFVLFLPETNLSEAVSLAERLRSDIAAMRHDYKGEALTISASFGVAQRSDETPSLDALIEVADRRLYQAKQQGRDRVCAS